MTTGVGVAGFAIRCGGAENEQEFWKLLAEARSSIVPVENPSGLSNFRGHLVKVGALLRDHSKFDRTVFGLSEIEALQMDPQHRQALEVSLEALEASNVVPTTFGGSIGVFASSGSVLGSYLISQVHCNDALRDLTGSVAHTGNDSNFLAGRLAFAFGLTGISLGVQSACSSSRVAFHLACQAILSN